MVTILLALDLRQAVILLDVSSLFNPDVKCSLIFMALVQAHISEHVKFSPATDFHEESNFN